MKRQTERERQRKKDRKKERKKEIIWKKKDRHWTETKGK